MTTADEFKEYDIRCTNTKCPQCHDGECGSPDPTVAAGTETLPACEKRKV
jgi:hypothetical protein